MASLPVTGGMCVGEGRGEGGSHRIASHNTATSSSHRVL